MDETPPPPIPAEAIIGLFEDALRIQEAPPPPPPPDSWLDPDFGYRIELFAGRGGSGLVWKAVGKQDGLPVALKLVPFHRDPESLLYRWMAEVSALASLQHPNLVALRNHGIASDGSSAWLALEWIEGTCLARFLGKEGPLPWRQAFDFVLQASAGLSEIHKAGLIHRDIKPANLLLEEPTGRVVVADLGIALDVECHAEARITRTFERAITPGYAAPEQFELSYQPHPAGDQYSLAVTLWELLSGMRPAGAFPKLHSLAKVPPLLDPVLRRALDPTPGKRYPSIDAFARALRRATRWYAPFRRPFCIAVALALAAIPAAKHFLASTRPSQAGPASVREITWPMRIQSGDLRVEEGTEKFMSVDLTLHRNGKMKGHIHTVSREKLAGFRGVIVLVFRDREGGIVAHMQSSPLGVNGKWHLSTRSERVDPWTDSLPPEQVERVASVEAFAMPKGTDWEYRMDQIRNGLQRPLEDKGILPRK